MKTKLLLSALIIPAALSFSSCLSSDKDRQEATLNYGGALAFNYVTDIQDPTVPPFVSLDPQYSFKLEFLGATLVTDMSNIRLTSDGQQLSFQTPELRLTSTNNGCTLSCITSNVVPQGQNQSYIFDDFNVDITERSIVNSSGGYKYTPVYSVNYLVNGRYKVKVFPRYYDVVGSLTSTSVDDGKIRISETAIISVNLNPDVSNPITGKAKIELTDISYADNLTIKKITSSDIPYTVNASGISIRTDAETVYKIKDPNDREMPNAGLSNININISVPSGYTTLSLRANLTGIAGEDDAVEYDLRATNLTYGISTTPL